MSPRISSNLTSTKNNSKSKINEVKSKIFEFQNILKKF